MRLSPPLVPALCLLAGLGCDPAGPAPFPPPEPDLQAENELNGDPYGGRFPLEKALEGLPEGRELKIEIETEAGTIPCVLDPGGAPLTVANFVGLARGLRPVQLSEEGPWETLPYYDGLPFHRIVDGQFLQTGKRGERQQPGFRIQDEIRAGAAFDRPGILAMANNGAPHSGGAQFFITIKELIELNGNYTVFGRCYEDWRLRELIEMHNKGGTVTIKKVTVSRG